MLGGWTVSRPIPVSCSPVGDDLFVYTNIEGGISVCGALLLIHQSVIAGFVPRWTQTIEV